jgi:hypothetical protein
MDLWTVKIDIVYDLYYVNAVFSLYNHTRQLAVYNSYLLKAVLYSEYLSLYCVWSGSILCILSYTIVYEHLR